MERTHRHNEAVAAFEHAHADWDETIRQIGLDRMNDPGIMGEWSGKDLVAHISGWQWKTIENMKAILAGTGNPPTPWPAEWNDPSNWDNDGDTERINTWIHEETAKVSVDDVMQQSRDQWQALREIVASVSLVQMDDPNLFPRLGGKSLNDSFLSGDFFGHIHEHMEADVTPWLAKHGHRL